MTSVLLTVHGMSVAMATGLVLGWFWRSWQIRCVIEANVAKLPEVLRKA